MNWLEQNLQANSKPIVFIFGHEPPFPQSRHIGDSLDQHPANRDRFYQLLETHDVTAMFNGHTHYYSKRKGNGSGVGDVWQFDAGSAALNHGDGFAFIDVIVDTGKITVNAYRDPEMDGTFVAADQQVINLQ